MGWKDFYLQIFRSKSKDKRVSVFDILVMILVLIFEGKIYVKDLKVVGGGGDI